MQVLFAALAGFLLAHGQLLGQEKLQNTVPGAPEQLWAEVQELFPPMTAPADWGTNAPTSEQTAAFRKQFAETMGRFTDKAREYIACFPTNENSGEARMLTADALTRAVALGEPDAEAQLSAYVSAVLADKSIPEDDRAGVLAFAGNAPFMKKHGLRLLTPGVWEKLHPEYETSSIESLRAALKQFPTNSLLYTLLLAYTHRSTGERQKELATEIIDARGAPPGAKTLAQHILKGTKPYQAGKPLDIHFTALDGREVDLAKLAGKVVLVQFWSTTCGPCIREMPAVKTAYEKFHDQGFEVVAISLDHKERDLRRFIKEKELPWPQYFDGHGWGNQYAVRYGIFKIPVMWLVDKRGNLRDTNARGGLARRVAALLGEQGPEVE